MYRLLICCLTVLVLSLGAAAQLPTSTLNGTVTDPQGAVVAGAKVIVTDTATGESREATSGSDGGFAVTDLAPGDYSVRVSASGFATSEYKGVRLEVGRASTLNVSLKIAKGGEVVEVSAAEIALNTTQSMVQGLVEAQAIETLPLNGRNFLDLAFLIPGNRPAPRFDPTKTNTLEVSSAGAYGRGGNIIIDGADNNDEVVGGTLMNLPEDGLAEFQIATKFTAEVGRSSTSIINVATKSGTNDVHGSEYFFFRHRDLQGLPATFDRTQPTPRFAREQFGGSLGGPLISDKLFGFFAGEYLNQDHAVPVGVRNFTTNTVPGGSAPAFVHDVRITSKGDWVPDANDHIALRYSFERSLDVDNGFLIRPLGGAANRQQSLNRYNSFLATWYKTFSSTQSNNLSYQKNYFINHIPAFSPNDPLTNPGGLALGNELRFPDLQDGANYRIPQRTRLARDQIRDTFYWSVGKHSLSFGAEFQYYGSDILFDIFGSGSIYLDKDFPVRNLHTGTPCSAATPCDDTDIPIDLALKSGAPVRPPTAPYEHNKYLGLFVQDDWRFRPGLTFNLGLRWDGDFNSLGETEQNKPCPNLTTVILSCEFIRNLVGTPDSSAKYKNFGPRVGFAWQPAGLKNTVVRGGYGIYYDRVILEPALLEELLNGRAVPIVAFGSSTCTATGAGATASPSLGNCSLAGATYAPGSPTLAKPFSGGSSPFGIGVNVVDNKAATPLVQQFTLGVQRQFGSDYLLSVDGIHTRGTRQLIPRFLRTLPPGATAAASTYIDCPNPRDPCTVIDPATGKPAATGCPADPSCQQITDIESSARTWYDALFVSFQKRPKSGPWHPGYNVSYTLSKTFDEQQDDQVSPSGAPTEDPAIVAMHVNDLKIEKGYATSDERHRLVLYGNMEIPWKLNISPIWSLSSSIPENLDVPLLGDGRLPNLPRNALGRQIQNGAALNAAIIAYNALPACLASGNTAGPLPCNQGQLLNAAGTGPFQVDPKIHFGHSLNSFDTRVTRTFHFKEPHSLQAIAEVFNLFNVSNIRGTTNRNYSGVNNVLTSGDFNRALETAGKFFGSYGPRAFQFALRYTF